VAALHGGDVLGAVTLTSSAGVSAVMDCRGLFCFIGAQPATEWLTGVAVDEDGFIRTDRDLTSEDLCTTWSLLMKRVASAVGEGASAIRSVHLALAPGA
jgi:thioredoxin reductase (NADPH)